MNLPQKLVALHEGLSAGRIPHAFGGAIALAYWTRDPRGTSDIDVNAFVPAADARPALAALPPGVERPAGTAATVAADGQVRLWWERTPVDLFFDYEPIHAQAAANSRRVPFEDTQIPILGPVELAVFKAMFDRTRDWADLEAMAAAGSLDVAAVSAGVTELAGADDPRVGRIGEAARKGARART